MKYNLLIPAMLVITTLSCKKETGSSPKYSLIEKWEHHNPLIGTSTYTYTYDQQGRAKDLQIFSNYGEFEYYDDRVIFNSFSGTGILLSRETMDLDNDGYISQKQYSQGNVVAYYQVNPDGYVESEFRNESGASSEDKYFYNGEGLLDSIRHYQNTSLRFITIYTEYDMQREYTIGDDNLGKSFMGRKFKHPPLKFKRNFLQQQVMVNYTHTYTYDDRGRITKDVRTATNGDNYTDSYEYY